MALILDDSLRSTAARPLPDSLVHSYNKRCFQNYEVAEQTLINKVLLPGEVAFAYYYDQLSPYGQSAIAAVGPLTHGSGNIIFKNSATIDAIKDDLMTTIADVNASINYLREDLLDSIDDALDHLDSSLDEVLEQFTGANNTYQLQINNIFNSIEESNTSIMNVVNTSFNSLHTLVTDNYNSLNELICDVSDGLFNKIETTESSILNYIRTVLSDGFGSAASDTEDLVEETSTSLNGIIDKFKNEINNKINTVNSTLTSGLGNLRIDVSNLQVDVSANKALYEDLSHKYQHLIDTSISQLQIDNVSNNLINTNTSIMNVVNTSFNDLYDLVSSKYEQLNELIYDTSDDVYDKISQIETSILTYIERTLSNTNISNDGSYASLTSVQLLNSSIDDIVSKLDFINSSINVVNSSASYQIQNVRTDVSNLQIDVSANRQLFEELEHKYNHLLDTSAVEELVNSKLGALQDLVDATEEQLKTYNYGSRLSRLDNDVSTILSYASSTVITNLSTDVSYLKVEDASIKHRFDHIMDVVNTSVNATINYINQSALETWEIINTSVNTTINAYTETIKSLVNDISVLTAQVNTLLAKQNELEQEHIDWGTDIDDIENTTDEVYNLEPFIQELDNRLSK